MASSELSSTAQPSRSAACFGATRPGSDSLHAPVLIALLAYLPLLPLAFAGVPALDEDALWSQIDALSRPAPPTQPFQPWFETTQTRLAALAARARLYQTLYPGGAHRDDAVRIELNALFELGTLAGGRLEPLCRRVTEVLRAPLSTAALHEAAYWDILGRHVQPTATRPATQPADRDRALADDYQRYVETYPTSRHTPRLASLVFDAADGRHDRTTQAAMLEVVKKHWPRHDTTAALDSAWRRAATQPRSVPESSSVRPHAIGPAP